MMTLIIDGNYFAQRLRNAMTLSFIETPEKDKLELFKGAAQSLSLEIRGLMHCIDSVVICRDYSSWRKRVEQTYPVESQKSEEKEVYKANRGVDKTYDSAKFYEAYDEFCKLCEEKLNIPEIRSYGAEADDIVYLISRARSIKKMESICWSSDGDYYQMVNEHTYLIKFPKKELFSVAKSTKYEKTVHDIFNKPAPKRSTLLLESFNNTVKRINPVKTILVKSVQGDAKDNVPPLFFWKKGTRTYKPSPLQIKKALVKMSLDLETITIDTLYDEVFYNTFVRHLFTVTKQTRDVEHTVKVYLSNLKMKHLHEKHIPVDIIKDIVRQYNAKHTMKLNVEKCSDSQYFVETITGKSSNFYFKNIDL